jgi:hypothetical protein
VLCISNVPVISNNICSSIVGSSFFISEGVDRKRNSSQFHHFRGLPRELLLILELVVEFLCQQRPYLNKIFFFINMCASMYV